MGASDYAVTIGLAIGGVAAGVAMAKPELTWLFVIAGGGFLLAGACWGMTTRSPAAARAALTGLSGAVGLICVVAGLRSLIVPAVAEPSSNHAAGVEAPAGDNVVVKGINNGTAIGTQNNYKTIVVPPKKENIGVKAPHLSLEKVVFFWIERGNDQYDIGVVAKVFNENERAFLIKSFGFDVAGFGVQGRGSWRIQTVGLSPTPTQSAEDSYIKAGQEGYYKLRVAARFEMKPGSLTPRTMPTPIILSTTEWKLSVDGTTVKLKPRFAGTHDYVITSDEWEDLRSSTSSIKIDDVRVSPAGEG